MVECGLWLTDYEKTGIALMREFEVVGKERTSREQGSFLKTAKPMARREKWSITTANQSPDGNSAARQNKTSRGGWRPARLAGGWGGGSLAAAAGEASYAKEPEGAENERAGFGDRRLLRPRYFYLIETPEVVVVIFFWSSWQIVMACDRYELQVLDSHFGVSRKAGKSGNGSDRILPCCSQNVPCQNRRYVTCKVKVIRIPEVNN